MVTDTINITMQVTWERPKDVSGAPYRWSDRKSRTTDPSWARSGVIYRWVRSPTGEVADIGETERSLGARVNNYTSATAESGAGGTNKMVFAEQRRLERQGDHLYLEFTDNVPGYDLTSDRQRKAAEGLLIGHYRPYLQWG